MLKKYFIAIFAILNSIFSFSFNDPELSTDLIADSLKEKAVAVVRYENISFEIQNEGKAILKQKRAITILKKEGDDFAHVTVHYDKNNKILSLSGEIYDAIGERVRKIKSSEISDNSYSSSYSLYEDNRYKYFEAYNNSYPYTVVSEYEVLFDGLLNYKTWVPIPAFEVSLQKSNYTIFCPESMDIRFKPINLDLNPEKKILDGKKIFEWEMGAQKAFEREPFSGPFLENMPVLWSAPTDFEFEGTKGNMESWESFGKWSLDLIDGRQTLSENTINTIKKLVEGINDEKEIIKILYEYLQKKTRYVSIQLGIGGWQPFPAETVDEVGYGDCKALSNYMSALLKIAGINSYFTIIGNGSTKIRYPDFPNLSQTNHALLCVPLNSDTIWLECTSHVYPCGYLGKSNCNRIACLITQEGGKLRKTPRYSCNDNQQTLKAYVTLKESGDAIVETETKYSGLQYENRVFLLDQSDEDKNKWLLRNLQLSNPVIKSFKYIDEREGVPTITEELKLELPEYSSKAGNRIFLKPNLMNYVSSPPDKVKNRKFKVVRETGFNDIDTIFYKIPEGYKLEASMNDVNYDSEFGSYSIKTEINNNQILYVRNIKMFEGNWPAEKYDDYREFYKQIWKADMSKMVFVVN